MIVPRVIVPRAIVTPQDVSDVGRVFDAMMAEAKRIADVLAEPRDEPNVLTMAQVIQAVELLRRNNVPPHEDGFYYVEPHPYWYGRAVRIAKRLRYPGGRKYRAALRELRRTPVLEPLVRYLQAER